MLLGLIIPVLNLFISLTHFCTFSTLQSKVASRCVQLWAWQDICHDGSSLLTVWMYRDLSSKALLGHNIRESDKCRMVRTTEGDLPSAIFKQSKAEQISWGLVPLSFE